MKFEVTLEELEEYACCIVDCNLNRDEACDYIKSCVTGSGSFDPEAEELCITQEAMVDSINNKLESE